MAWTIKLSDSAEEQLEKLDKPTARRMIRYLRERALEHGDPRSKGNALVGDLSGFWRYRVGDYRIVCDLRNDELVVLVVKVGHRKDIYD